jgi:hypothetical protein
VWEAVIFVVFLTLKGMGIPMPTGVEGPHIFAGFATEMQCDQHMKSVDDEIKKVESKDHEVAVEQIVILHVCRKQLGEDI